MEKEKKKRKGGAGKDERKEEETAYDIVAKCMNIQEVFAKVSSSIAVVFNLFYSSTHFAIRHNQTTPFHADQ